MGKVRERDGKFFVSRWLRLEGLTGDSNLLLYAEELNRDIAVLPLGPFETREEAEKIAATC